MEKTMPKRVKVEGDVPPQEVEAIYRDCTNPHDHKRLLALRMAQQGQWTMQQIAKAVGTGRATIGRFLRAYREEGLDGLLKRGHGGRQPQLKPDDIQALEKGLRQGQFKSGRQIRQWLKAQRGISLSRSGVYYWLSQVKGTWKVPRKAHVKPDPPQQEAFKQNIVAKLEALDIPYECRVRIWVEDEQRYGLISNIRRVWTLRGHRVVVPVQQKYQWGYVYGACELVTGDAEFAFLPRVCLQGSQLFLNPWVATAPQAIHVVLWDQAGFHPRLAQHPLPEQIRIVEFPPYCPELNPVEKLWDQVKCHVANEVFEVLAAIESKIEPVLSPFWQSVERVMSLLGDNWLTRGVAAFLKQREASAGS